MIVAVALPAIERVIACSANDGIVAGQRLKPIIIAVASDRVVVVAALHAVEIPGEPASLDADEPLTISVGAVSFANNTSAAGQLVEAADAELYRAKSLGRNRTCSPGSS